MADSAAASRKPKSPPLRELANDFGFLFSVGNVLLVAGNFLSMGIMGAASAIILISKLLPKKNPGEPKKIQSFIQNKANSQALNAMGLLISGGIGLALAGLGMAAFPFFAAICYGLGHGVMAGGRYYRAYCLAHRKSPKKHNPKSLWQHTGRFCYRHYSRITPGMFGAGYVFIALMASGWVLKGLACFSSLAGFYGSVTKKDNLAYRMFASSGIFTTVAHIAKATGDLARGDLIAAGQAIYQCSYTVLFSAGEYRLAQITPKPAPKRVFVPSRPASAIPSSDKRKSGGFVIIPPMPTQTARILFGQGRRR